MAICGSPLTLLLPFWLLLLLHGAAPVSSQSLPGCQAKCGNVDIHYPFGIGDGCFRRGFRLTCNDSRPFLGGLGVQEILIREGQFRTDMPSGQYCFTPDGKPRTEVNKFSANLTLSRFSFSADRNVFTAIGCNVMVRFGDPADGFMTGCVSACNRRTKIKNGVCTGLGCCQTAFPEGLKYFEGDITTFTFSNYSVVGNFSRCSYAFLVEKDAFQFNSRLLTIEYDYGELRPPLIMDWVVDTNTTCAKAKTNLTAYGCRSNYSHCIDSDVRNGYFCNCSSGYEGNPYIDNGCTDINECKIPHTCKANRACINYIGSYSCVCPNGTRPLDKGEDSPCVPIDNKGNKTTFGIALGFGIAMGLLLIIGCFIMTYKKLQKMRVEQHRTRLFNKNYGLLCNQQVISCGGENIVERIKFFSLHDLEKATNHFDKSCIAGKGGHGIVYKGLLNLRVVAIKMSNFMIQQESEQELQREIEQFNNEILLLSQINHRNVVKLIGCCLENEVPLLVYEFISNGTLYEHIHKCREESSLTWEDRLRIAIEITSALAYLHSAANVSIFHRDIKTSNILLDDKLTAKISDFGASKYIASGETHVSTKVEGTRGYLDPEYMQTGQLTEKTDVYSLAVILVELLTSQEPTSRLKYQEERYVISSFMWAIEENRLFEVVDPSIIEDNNSKEVELLGRLANACLSINGRDRPTMKSLLVSLESLMEKFKYKYMRKSAKSNHYGIETNTIGVYIPSNNSATTTHYNINMNSTLDESPLL